MKIRCICGHVMSTVDSPHADGFWMIPERAISAIETRMPDEARVSQVIDAINDAASQVYRCPSCGELLVFEDGRGKAPAYYRLHDGSTSANDRNDQAVDD